jgi:hypothetical protein
MECVPYEYAGNGCKAHLIAFFEGGADGSEHSLIILAYLGVLGGTIDTLYKKYGVWRRADGIDPVPTLVSLCRI